MAGKTKLVDILAGIGLNPALKKTGYTGEISAADVATSAYYADMMKYQTSALTDQLTKVINKIKEVTPDIILEALQPTFELSQEYVPFRTGALKESGYLEKQVGGGVARVVMGYAKGGKPDYAVLVHERVDIKHEPPTRAKYLLSALEEDSGNIYGRIVDLLTIEGAR